MSTKTYKEKLLDPRWQKKRLEILSRDDFSCCYCGDKDNTLHVHHKSYGDGEPWEIENNHLITLCKECHEQEELELKEYSELFIKSFRLSPFRADDLREISWGLNAIEIKNTKTWLVARAYCLAFGSEEIQNFLVEFATFYKNVNSYGLLVDKNFKKFLETKKIK